MIEIYGAFARSIRLDGKLFLNLRASSNLVRRGLSTKSAIERGLRKSSREPRSWSQRESPLRPAIAPNAYKKNQADREDASRHNRMGTNARPRFSRSHGSDLEPREGYNTFQSHGPTKFARSFKAAEHTRTSIASIPSRRNEGAYSDKSGQEKGRTIQKERFSGALQGIDHSSRHLRGRTKGLSIPDKESVPRWSNKRGGLNPAKPTVRGRRENSSSIEKIHQLSNDTRGKDDRDLPNSAIPSSSHLRKTSLNRRELQESQYDYDDTTYIPRASVNPRTRKGPIAIPRTTSASEFLYGTSAVRAALKSDKRKLYRLYIYIGENTSGPDLQRHEALAKLGHARGITVDIVRTSDWLVLMEKMSSGRPHNGCILEASPLARRPIKTLRSIDSEQRSFQILLDHQTQEDALVNGTETLVEYDGRNKRYPFLILLDGILDPGNLGGILRSAFFLGADAVIVSTHSAPLGPVSLKASAGATENLPLMSVHDTGGFILSSQKNGWKFYAAAPPKSTTPGKSTPERSQKHFLTSNLGSPLMDHPCVLLLGGEGEGLKPDLHRKADFTVSIEGNRSGQGGVDSLNVSVAGGLLCEAFLRREKTN